MEELKEFLIHKRDFGSSVKACMVKVFTEQEMTTCSVRGKSKDGKQRNCLPQEKVNAIIGKISFTHVAYIYMYIVCTSLVLVMCFK